MSKAERLALSVWQLQANWYGEWGHKDALRIEARDAARAAAGLSLSTAEWRELMLTTCPWPGAQQNCQDMASENVRFLISLQEWERAWAASLPLAYVGVKPVLPTDPFIDGVKVKQGYADQWEKQRLKVFLHEAGAVNFIQKERYDCYEVRLKWEHIVPRHAPGESREVPPAVAIYLPTMLKPLQMGFKQ